MPCQEGEGSLCPMPSAMERGGMAGNEVDGYAWLSCLQCMWLTVFSVPTCYASLCCYCCLVVQLCPTLCDPMDWDFTGKNTGKGCHFLFPGYLPNPGIALTSPACISCIAGRFFTAEPLGKPMCPFGTDEVLVTVSPYICKLLSGFQSTFTYTVGKTCLACLSPWGPCN